MADRWEKRTYTCAVCRTEAFDFAAPIGWLRVQRRIEGDAQGDTFMIVGFYCGLPCLAGRRRQMDGAHERAGRRLNAR
jgi:hypothetical protein